MHSIFFYFVLFIINHIFLIVGRYALTERRDKTRNERRERKKEKSK